MAHTINVLKASGEYEPFSEEKVRSSLKRVGVGKKLADRIVARVKEELYDGISTTEIYENVFALLRDRQARTALRYSLKRAVMELGPTGFPFEKFVARVLEHEGYRAKTNLIVSGRCVSHEIDVSAEKGGGCCMIECKFHNKQGIRSDIKDALCAYARFLDVQKLFGECWLVTNTKATSTVRRYGKCVGLKVISWDYPVRGNLFNIIDQGELHPVTGLSSIGGFEKRRLLEHGFVFCRDLDAEAFALLPSRKRNAVKREISDGASARTDSV
jgi:hypothetical protein